MVHRRELSRHFDKFRLRLLASANVGRANSLPLPESAFRVPTFIPPPASGRGIASLCRFWQDKHRRVLWHVKILTVVV